MKKTLLIALLIPVFSFFGCPDDLLDVTFGMNMADVTFKLSPSATAGTYPFSEKTVNIDLQKEINKHGGDIDKIKEARVNSMTITLITPDTTDFSAIDMASIFIQTPSMKDPTLLGTVTNNGAAVKVLTMIPEDVDLIAPLKEESMIVTGSVTTNKEVKQEVIMKALIKLDVVASAL